MSLQILIELAFLDELSVMAPLCALSERWARQSLSPFSSAEAAVPSAHSILIIAPQPFFLERGTPINVRAMASTLAEAGYDVHLLVFPYGTEVSIPGVTIYRSWGIPGINSVPIGPSWRKALLDVPFAFSAALLVLRRRFSVLHGVEEGGCIAGFLSLVTRTPFVFDMDSCMPEQLRKSGFRGGMLVSRIVERVERFFIRRARAVLTVCSALSEKAALASSTVKIFQIEDFPYQSATDAPVKSGEELRRAHGLERAQIILYTGNFEKYQGLDLLLKSFAKLCDESQRRESLKLLLVGGGTLDSPQLEHYRKRARSLGIESSVVFTGSRPAEEMGGYMAVADVLVSPRIEGANTPLKIYSYMASGTPVVATRIRSHTQVLDDSTAYLADTSPESFAGALHAALDLSDGADADRKRRADAAKHLVETRYSKTQFRSKLIAMYHDLLGGPAQESEA